MVSTPGPVLDTAAPLTRHLKRHLHIDSMHAKPPPVQRSRRFGEAEPSEEAHRMLTGRYLQARDAVICEDRKGPRDHGTANTPSMSGGIHHDPIDTGIGTLDRQTVTGDAVIGSPDQPIIFRC